ncbi:MAG TPA: M48 family metalloprotease [Gemmatimonadaceae bacterium]|nr:M48 family metalloprotease [Gemmatimonadaceae bacterium]
MVGLLSILLAIGCATNPVTGKKELALISESEEIAMGRQGAADVTATVGLYPDIGLQAYVNRIGQALAARTERPRLAWEFHVIDDASVNAFALPGGFIFVTRGLLSYMTNEAELASVLGHENGHVAARHSVQQISRQQVAVLGLGLGSVLSPAIARFGDAAGAGLGLLFLKYGRDDEIQADDLGFRYALADGYDTREMISLFEMLQRDDARRGGGGLPEWQATHPDPGNRIKHVQSLIAASKQDFSATKLGEVEFLQRIDGMVYGVNPRDGFFQDEVFVHPDLAFLFQFPAGWETQNQADAVAGISAAHDALIELRAAQGNAADAAKNFLGQQGLQAGQITQGTIHGNRAVSGEFTAQDGQGGSVQGIATFIEYGRGTWRILAYSATAPFESYRSAFQRSINSFDRLTDPAALAVQPMHVRVDKAPRSMSLQQFNAQLPSSIPLAELAVINGVDQGAQLRAGQSIKRVIGTPPARVSNRP